MSKPASTQWDFVRFATTLGYFGEVPFVGSFRWLQKWLGQSPTVAGKTLNSMQRKVVVTGNFPMATFDLLQKRVSSTIAVSACQQTADSSGAKQANLCKTLGVADTVVVWNSADFSSVVADVSSSLGENSDVIRQGAFDFTQANSDISAWGALDDVVMGGVSEGSFVLHAPSQSTSRPSKSSPSESNPSESGEQQRALFSGRVSTNNSGGFSSVRTRNFEPPFNFSGWAGLWLRVKGDGQRYKFIVRNSQAWDSPAYVYIFNTLAGQWIDVRVPFAELVPTFRAKSVPQATPFEPAHACTFQLMLSKFEYDGRLNPSFSPGPFELAVAKIEAYRARQGVPLIVVGAANAAERDRQQTTLAESGLRYQFIEPENQDLVEAIATALS